MYQIVKIPNGEISYYTLGEGEPLLLLHGYCGTFLHWEDSFLNALKKKFKVYCLNYRGIGFSKSNKDEYSIYSFAEDISQMIETLKIKNVSILGYSMGGYIAQELALNFTKEIKNLYLVSTALGASSPVLNSIKVAQNQMVAAQTIEERVQERLELNFPNDCREKMRSTQTKWVQQYDLLESKLTDKTRNNQRYAIEVWKNSFDEKKLNQYSNIKIKTHIFTGFKDIIFPYQDVLKLFSKIPHSQITIFENGGHGLLSQFETDIVKLL